MLIPPVRSLTCTSLVLNVPLVRSHFRVALTRNTKHADAVLFTTYHVTFVIISLGSIFVAAFLIVLSLEPSLDPLFRSTTPLFSDLRQKVVVETGLARVQMRANIQMGYRILHLRLSTGSSCVK
jgi:hypothetical protein